MLAGEDSQLIYEGEFSANELNGEGSLTYYKRYGSMAVAVGTFENGEPSDVVVKLYDADGNLISSEHVTN